MIKSVIVCMYIESLIHATIYNDLRQTQSETQRVRGSDTIAIDMRKNS